MDLRQIEWTVEEKRNYFDRMATLFMKLGQQAIMMNHYDFFDKFGKVEPHITIDHWKAFITDGRVAKHIQEEFDTIKSVELRKIINNISESKSVGQAQLINALTKLTEGDDEKKGPAFIYTYIPPTVEQEQADNIIMLDNDPFIQRG